MKWIRVAAQAGRRWNMCKTAVQTAFLWGSALYVVPRWIAGFERAWGLPVFPPLPMAGVAIFLCASCLGLASGWAMSWYGEGTPLPLDTARRLVIRGPYRVVRNPMAVAGLAQGAGVGLALGSPLVLLYVMTGGLLWEFIARPVEEADLLARFGEEYRRYRDAVPCWRPVWPVGSNR